jgi:hypothetical protein
MINTSWAALEDSALVDAFNDGRVTKETFRHPEHIRLAFAYLSRYPDLAEAALRFRSDFRRFTRAQGVDHIYNETLTWAYLVLVRRRMKEQPGGDSLGFVQRNPDLCDHRGGLITRYYDVEQVKRSALAKELFLLPDR